VLLIERRHTAVSRTEIFDSVWSDVVVSDGALSQAVRTLRRVLGDDSRDPRFIRTVSRHGYSFIYSDVAEHFNAQLTEARQATGAAVSAAALNDVGQGPAATYGDDAPQMNDLIARLLKQPTDADDEELRDAAEQLHLLGTARTLAALPAVPSRARALALLRDARWDVPGAGPVPLLGQPDGLAAAFELVRLRVSRAMRLVKQRWASASAGAAIAGAVTGGVGGFVLVIAPTSHAAASVIPLLAGLGAAAGAIGACGIGAGIVAAEVLARSRRAVAIVAGGALGGLAVGTLVHVTARIMLEGLFGLRLMEMGGPLDGLALGGAAGVGYGLTTRRPGGGGMAIASGRARWTSALVVAACCALAGFALSVADRPMVGGVINSIGQASRGSHIALTPLAALIGDPLFGRMTKTSMALLESGAFGFGLAFGLTRRPPSRAAHNLLTSR
jgi:hypothetical protein